MKEISEEPANFFFLFLKGTAIFLPLWGGIYFFQSLIIFGGDFREVLTTPHLVLGNTLFVLSLVVVVYLRELLTRNHAVLQELQKTSLLATQVFNSADEGILTIDRKGLITFVNPTAEKLLGYDAEELLGEELHEKVHHSDLDGVPCSIEECSINKSFLLGESIASHEDYFWRKEGIVFPVNLISSPLLSQNEIVGTVILFSDASMQRAHENLIRQNEERYRMMLSIAQDAFVSMDVNGKILDWNRRAEEIFGWQKSEVVGKEMVEKIIPHSMRAAHREGVKRFLQTGESRVLGSVIEITALHKEGYEFPIELKISVLQFGEDIVFSAFVHDSRKRKNIEQQLRQAQKLEAIGTLAGGIAHDFNNILTAMIGFAELVKEKFEENSKERKNIEGILQGGLRAKNLVMQMLTFSRRSEAVIASMNIVPVLKESVKLLRASLPSTITIKERIHVKSADVVADPVQIQQVIMNLCTNAAHAMSDGGTLELFLEETVLDEAFCSSHIECLPGSYIKMSVKDSGVGILPEHLDRIFEPFFTTKNVGQGTGLGLSVVHGIVLNYKGTVLVQSTPMVGTVIEVYIPRAVVPEMKKILDKAEIEGGKERIMVVDDEKMIIQVMKGLLGRWGYRVSAFDSSVNALEAFEENPDSFDLVITDMTMPRITGDILSTRILEIRPDLPIILCTGFHERISEEVAEKIGIRTYLMKPVIADVLAKAIRNLLDETIK